MDLRIPWSSTGRTSDRWTLVPECICVSWLHFHILYPKHIKSCGDSERFYSNNKTRTAIAWFWACQYTSNPWKISWRTYHVLWEWMVSIRKKSSNNFHSPKGIVAFLFLYESHYSDSQHCGNDQRKQNEASDLSVGCLLSLWQCVFSLGGYKRVPSSAKEWRGSESGFGMRSWGCTDMNQSFFLRKNAFFKSIWIACKPFAKFNVCRVIKISEDKIHELKRRNGRGNGNAAILILPQCQMRLWMFHGNECIAWIKIEP